MPYNKNTAWTDYWLRHLSWRELKRMMQPIYSFGIPCKGLIRSRCLRLQAELARRKREGFGGMCARL
jgi:hypothetical protein